MQPKTKLQKRVMELFPTLKPLTKAQEQWGLHLNPTKAFFNSKGNICAYCGQSMGESLTCPVCKREHKGVAGNNQQYERYYTFNLCVAVGEFQILRTFEVWSKFQRRKSAKVEYREVCQSWIDAKGKETRVARGKSLGMFGQGFSWYSPMEIRTLSRRNGWGYYDDLHRWVQKTDTYPRTRSFSPSVKRNGLQDSKTISQSNMHPLDFITRILTDSKCETLLKLGYGNFIGATGIDTYWQQIKIATRHNYRIADWEIWKDTLDMLQEEGKDICNPHYICPINLMQVHDKLLARKNARDLREKELSNRDAQKAYVKAKSAYFGFAITDKELSIEVIKSVAEMILEGERMNHCVGKLKYYEKPNSLILSAKVNGKSMETIEVDLRDFRIVQSRGKCNQNSPYHDRIVDLMRGNMEQIRKIKQKANKAQKVA